MRNTINIVVLACFVSTVPALALDIQPRIIGGCNAETDGHSWMAAVAKTNYGNEWQSTFCGATVVHENWAITAAHCMYYGAANTALIPENIDLIIGTTVLDSGEGQHHRVSEIHVHPSYSPSANNYHNDIALLRLSNPTNARPARLATVKAGANFDALATGWGRRNEVQVAHVANDYPQTLQEVNLSTFDNSDCYSGLLDSQICAGELAGGEDSCSGDSGGPLLLQSQGDDTLVGIVSYGYQCALPGNLGVYTSVSSFLPWIAQTTVDPVSNISDIPLPSAYSENFSDFGSNCELEKSGQTEETPASTSTTTSSGGGAMHTYWLAILALMLATRSYIRSKANNKKA